MLGVRGGAWAGGIFVVLAALYLAKLGYDQGYFTPILRVTAMIVAGTAALVWAEIGLRKGYRPTADAISARAWCRSTPGEYAAHVSFRLIESPLRHSPRCRSRPSWRPASRFAAARRSPRSSACSAAWPRSLLSQNSSNALGLFIYLAVLNTGFLWVARKQSWTFITAIALAGTSLMEFGWMATRLNPDKLPVAVIGFAVLGAIYMWHAVDLADDEAQATTHVLGLLGGTLPLAWPWCWPPIPASWISGHGCSATS